MESTQRSPGHRPHKVRFTRNAQAWAFLVRSLARPLPTTTTTLGRGWVPGGSAPYDFRTRSARLDRTPNLFGAGMNLGPLRPPPAAARTYQIHVSPLFPLAPLVCLAFSDLFGRGRCPHRPASGHRPPYNTHNIRSSYAVGRDDPARLVVTITPPHPALRATFPPGWGRLCGRPKAWGRSPGNPFMTQRQRS